MAIPVTSSNALKEGSLLEGLEVLSHKVSWDCHNVPMTSNYQDFIEPESINKCKDAVRVGHPSLTARFQEADFILFVSAWTKYATSQFEELLEAVQALSDAPVLIVGRKHFGEMYVWELLEYGEQGFINTRQKSLFHLAVIKAVPEAVKQSYFDLHELICGNDDSCPIATPEGYLIS